MRLSEPEPIREDKTPKGKKDFPLEPAKKNDSIKDSESEPKNSKGFAPVLNNRRFLILWSGQIFSQLADKVYLVLMIAIITNRFQLSDQPISHWVSRIMIAFTIPAVLFGSLAGVYVDRWSKKGVLVISNLLRGVFVLVLPAFLWLSHGQIILGRIPLGFIFMLGITFLVSTLTQFFAPAEQAVIPLIVKKEHLLAANSLYTTTMMALLIIGFAVGEPLLSIADRLINISGLTHWHIGKELLVGGAYVLAGILLLSLKTGEKKEDRRKESLHPIQDIWDGIVYLNKNHRVRNALIQLVILFSVFAALAVLAVSMADKIPQIEADQFGIILAAAGVGMAISAAFLGHGGGRFTHAQLSLWGSLGIAISLIGLSWATKSLWLALPMTTVLGGFAALVGIPMQTTIQSETPADMRGKVFGLQNNAVNIALSLPLVLAAEAEARFGLSSVFLALASLALVGGVLTWYISHTGKVNLSKVDQ